jgi:hypothetical protein
MATASHCACPASRRSTEATQDGSIVNGRYCAGQIEPAFAPTASKTWNAAKATIEAMSVYSIVEPRGLLLVKRRRYPKLKGLRLMFHKLSPSKLTGLVAMPRW